MDRLESKITCFKLIESVILNFKLKFSEGIIRNS